MSQTPSQEKGQFVQFPLHLIYERKDLTRDDKWVLLAIMGSCWTEEQHRLSYREVAALSDVPLALLSSYTDKKTGKVHEGILNRLARLDDIHVMQTKKINTRTGKPTGQAQTYIHINYKKFWQQNAEYCQAKKAANISPYQVSEGEYESVPYTNASVSNVNASVPYTNKSVHDLPLEMTTYITKIDKDITDREEESIATTPVASAHSLDAAHSLEDEIKDQQETLKVLQDAGIVPTVTPPEQGASDEQPTAQQNRRTPGLPTRTGAVVEDVAVSQEVLPLTTLAEPDMSGKWNNETCVQYAEWCNHNRYKGKMRDEQLKAAESIHRNDRDITLAQFKTAYDERNDPWWKEHKKKLHVTDMKARGKSGIDRVHEMLQRLEDAATASTTRKNPSSSPMQGGNNQPTTNIRELVRQRDLRLAAASQLQGVSL